MKNPPTTHKWHAAHNICPSMFNKNNAHKDNMQLTVYKASAGSGKTFRLAVEYIKLLIKNPESAHKGILAVTFTNKATGEMKERIMSQLYGIWKGLPDSNDYLKKVTEELNMGSEEVRRRAGIALAHLIHDFDRFRVETIDKFFQRVLRNLSHELGLPSGLKVGLNDKQVEELAVDQMIERLSAKDKELEWIIDYISHEMSDNKNWNVTWEIKKFGINIFKDVYKKKRSEINNVTGDDAIFESFVKAMQKIKNDFEKQMAEYEPRFMKILEDNGMVIEDILSYIRGFYKKLSNKALKRGELWTTTCKEALTDNTKWITKDLAKKRPELLTVTKDHLDPLFQEVHDAYEKGITDYCTANLALEQINQLRLLSAIEKRVSEVNANANRFLLSDTQQLLAQFIKDTDSPFIYEKTGTQINHIMIDEFQDTSTVQWDNFLVLLRECMSRANTEVSDVAQNLIVGDVKQSIYRWRSGDWQLLNNIERFFGEKQMKVEPLRNNYRSAKNIIRFNNAFFDVAIRNETANEREVSGDNAVQIEKAYSDVEQLIPDSNGEGGEVNITLLSKDDFEQRMLDKLVETVDYLIAKGARQKDIAILLRKNDKISLIAERFTQARPDIHLVSDEAFRMDSSLAVNMIIETLALLLHPEDLLTRAELAKQYQENIAKSPTDIASQICNANEEKINRLLPEAFVSSFSTMLEMPITDLIEHIYKVLDLERLSDQSAYVCAFYDAVCEYTADYSPGIEALLQEWDDTLCKKTISSDGIDGIRILTIHKSKGLEYDNVIVPFANWDMKIKETLWCATEKEPFCQMPLIPVKCKKEMDDSHFAADYRNEHLQSTVDHMNMLYVAFTRAKKNLYVIGTNGNDGRSAIILQSLDEVTGMLDGATLTEENGTKVFHYGTFKESGEEKKEESSNIFMQGTSKVHVDVRTFPVPVTFRQSNKSTEFTLDEDDSAVKHSTYIKRGNILHNIFSQIATKDDVKRILKEMEQDGILYDEVSRDDLISSINKCLDNPVASEWFSGRWRTYRECTILETIDGKMKEHRPDRVMTDGNSTIVVDYKFGTPKTTHVDQIHRYMRLLDDMGHQNIKGYLWYVDRNEIREA